MPSKRVQEDIKIQMLQVKIILTSLSPIGLDLIRVSAAPRQASIMSGLSQVISPIKYINPSPDNPGFNNSEEEAF